MQDRSVGHSATGAVRPLRLGHRLAWLVEDVEEEASTLQALLRTGLVEEPSELVVINDEPNFPSFDAYAKQSPEADPNEVWGFGIGLNGTRARIKAVAECLERLCDFVGPTDVRIGQYDPDDQAMVDPIRFWVGPGEYPSPQEVQDLRATPLRWCKARGADGQDWLVPSQIASVSHRYDDELQIRPERITTGSALGRSGTDDALQRGLQEVLERDAFVKSFLWQEPLTKATNLNRRTKAVAEYVERYRLLPKLFWLPSIGNIPVALAITFDLTTDGPAVTAGTAGSSDPDEALVKALLESIQGRRTIRLFGHGAPVPPDGGEIRTVEDRSAYWGAPKHRSVLDGWLKSAEVPTGDPPSDAQSNLLSTDELEYFIIDISLPPIRDQGFEVLRIVSPDALPLYLDELARPSYSPLHGRVPQIDGLPPHPML